MPHWHESCAERLQGDDTYLNTRIDGCCEPKLPRVFVRLGTKILCVHGPVRGILCRFCSYMLGARYKPQWQPGSSESFRHTAAGYSTDNCLNFPSRLHKIANRGYLSDWVCLCLDGCRIQRRQSHKAAHIKSKPLPRPEGVEKLRSKPLFRHRGGSIQVPT